MKRVKDTSTSTEKALDILTLFSLKRPELGITEISSELGLSKGTVHRLVSTLVEKGFLQQNMLSHKYGLGLRVFELGAAARENLELTAIVQPLIENLSRAYNLTVSVGVLDDGEALIIAKAEANDTVRVTASLGGRLPLYPTALGKVLLCSLSEAELNFAVQSTRLRSALDLLRVDRATLAEILEEVRRNGVAIDNQQYCQGLSAVAAPIKDSSGKVVAGVVAALPYFRLGAGVQLETIAGLVKSTASEISLRLGGSI